MTDCAIVAAVSALDIASRVDEFTLESAFAEDSLRLKQAFPTLVIQRINNTRELIPEYFPRGGIGKDTIVIVVRNEIKRIKAECKAWIDSIPVVTGRVHPDEIKDEHILLHSVLFLFESPSLFKSHHVYRFICMNKSGSIDAALGRHHYTTARLA